MSLDNYLSFNQNIEKESRKIMPPTPSKKNLQYAIIYMLFFINCE